MKHPSPTNEPVVGPSSPQVRSLARRTGCKVLMEEFLVGPQILAFGQTPSWKLTVECYPKGIPIGK